MAIRYLEAQRVENKEGEGESTGGFGVELVLDEDDLLVEPFDLLEDAVLHHLVTRSYVEKKQKMSDM